MNDTLEQSPLGKKTAYINEYSPELLFPVTRKLKRDDLQLPSTLPFHGVDIWNGFELSWLNEKGKPIISLAQFIFSCDSPNIIESKSFKLYLNSFNQTKFYSLEKVKEILERDLSEASGAAVKIKLMLTETPIQFKKLDGKCLDELDIICDKYQVDPELLQTENSAIEETLYSDLLKSNCLMTGQPDWGSVQISYRGKKINHESLLKYIVSFRNHSGFAEHCIERIFMDILRYCQPEKLSIFGSYTRRGGLDISALRSTISYNQASRDWTNNYPEGNIRLLRQ